MCSRRPAAPPPFSPCAQVEGLRARLDDWVGKVSQAALTLEEEAVGVAVQAS